jgi:hypothetical protein
MEDENSMSVTICGNVKHLRETLDIPGGRLSAAQYCEEWIQQAWDAAENWDGGFPVWVASDRFFEHWRGGRWSRSHAGHWVANGVLAVYYRGCGEEAGRALLEHIMANAKLGADWYTTGGNVRGDIGISGHIRVW